MRIVPTRCWSVCLAVVTAVAAGVLGGASAVRAESVSALEKKLGQAITEGRADDAERLVEELLGEKSKLSTEALVRVAATADDATYRQIVLGLAKSEATEVADVLCRRVTSGVSEKERVVAAAACANRQDERTLDALIEAVTTNKEVVRRMVLRALVARRNKKAVPALIDALTKAEAKGGNGAGLVQRALRDLTGLSLDGAIEWQSFWDSKGAAFELPEPGAEASPAAVKEGSTAARFFGRTLDADRIVFVIDVSGSMLIADDRPPTEGRPETGGEKREHDTDSRVRIDRAKAELLNVLAELPESADFTILAYSGFPPEGYRSDKDPDEKSWLPIFQPRLVKASEANVKKAAEFVKGLQARGSTFTGRAIEMALEVKDAELIILLSDGAPTEWVEEGGRWKTLTPDDVRAKIRTANRFKRVTIDAFGFEGDGGGGGGGPFGRGGGGASEFVEFMRAVAKENGGTYQSIE